MNQNSLIEIGSKADVIIRFNSETTVNGVLYAAKEPYLYLKEANVIINYTNEDKSGSAIKTIIANSQIKPKSVMIGGISFSRKLAALLAQFIETNSNYNYTVFEYGQASREIEDLVGTIYLTTALDNTKPYFVYDSGYNKKTVLYDGDSNSLSGEELEDGKTYYISFSTVKIGTKFDLNKPCMPYMSLEIQGKGNIEKITKEVIMYFDKVSLNSVLEFTFIQNDMINVPLVFHIIDDENNYVVFED